MLKDYFSARTNDKERRVMAVEAALEVAKASVSASSTFSGSKTEYDLKNVASDINGLANAIQASLEQTEK